MRILNILIAALYARLTGNSPVPSQAEITPFSFPVPAQNPPSLPQPEHFSFWTQSQILIPNTISDESAIIFAILSKLLSVDLTARIQTDERDIETLNKLFANSDTNSTPLVLNLNTLLTDEKLYSLLELFFSEESDLLYKLRSFGMGRKGETIDRETRTKIREALSQYSKEASKHTIYLAFYNTRDLKTAVFKLGTNVYFALDNLPGRHQILLKRLRDNSESAYISQVKYPYSLWRHSNYARKLSTEGSSAETNQFNIEEILGKGISYDRDGLMRFIKFQAGARNNDTYRGFLINEAAANAILKDERERELLLSNPTHFPNLMDIYNRALIELNV